MVTKKLITSVAALALMAGVMSQPAKADFGITVGIGVVMGIVGYVFGKHVLSTQQGGSPPMKYSPQASDPQAMCASKFRSYDPRTGLIALNDGTRKICPYLQ